MAAFNQWSARGWYLVAVAMVDYSLKRTEVTFKLLTNGIMKGSRVVIHVVFPTPLADLSCLLMFGGG